MDIIAHRGDNRYTPENTMAAFMSAAKYPIKGIEFDLQWSKDNIPVVIHDSTINRTTNGSGAVRSFTLQELKQFDAGSSFKELFRGEKIPSFTEVLIWSKDHSIKLHVELKQQADNHQLFVRSCVNDILKHDVAHSVIISTFYHPYIAEVKKQAPEIETALLTKTPIFRGPSYAQKIKADGIHIRHSFHAVRFYRRWSKKNVTVRVYNVKTIREAKICKICGVNAIITDDPRAMTEDFELSER